LKPQEIRLAEQLVENLSENFKPEQYHDTFQERLRALVEARQKDKTLAAKAAPHRAKVIDMTEAVRQSFGRTKNVLPRAPGFDTRMSMPIGSTIRSELGALSAQPFRRLKNST